MKTSELRQYRKNAEALEAIDRLLADRFVVDSVQGSRGAPDYTLTSRRTEGLPSNNDTAALKLTQRKLQCEQNAIRTFISGIKVRRIHWALYYYCIDGADNHVGNRYEPSWEQVAEKMHEDSPDALRVAVERHLKKYFQNIRICS